jgi:N-acetylmuramoyl-L-alanine amidase
MRSYHVLAATRSLISDILFAVPQRFLHFAILFAVLCCSSGVASAGAWPQNAEPAPPPPQQELPSQNPVPPAIPPPAPAHLGPLIVIDPAHGGTDNGAQGQNGIVEKEIVLRFARQIRVEFERQGFRVLLTRNDDSNPSYEDRAAIANAHRDTIFISVHVSSTGKIGTARVYSYQYSNSSSPTPVDAPKSLAIWEEAQRPYLDASHRLADLVQTELAQRFTGSAPTSTSVAVRELRSVSALAIAIELSSVSVSDQNVLAVMGAPLASALVRGVQLLRPGAAASRDISGESPRVAGAN